MRAAFVETLTDLAEGDRRIILLTGDLGYSVLEPFVARCPNQFLNVGVAEQNMVGLATGLAEAGFIPFVYSIVPFAVLRPYEFIRNGPVAHQLPVRIVGIGGGVEYGTNGLSHYGLEDVAVTSVQPGLTVVVPADASQTRAALRAVWDLAGPVYLRLGKDTPDSIEGLDGRFSLGHCEAIGSGRELLIVAMGTPTRAARHAVVILEAAGIACTLAVVSSLNPSPVANLRHLLALTPAVLTVEAHYASGGVGSLVAEIIAEHGLGTRLRRCAISGRFDGVTGSTSYLHVQHGLSAPQLAQAGRDLVYFVRQRRRAESPQWLAAS